MTKYGALLTGALGLAAICGAGAVDASKAVAQGAPAFTCSFDEQTGTATLTGSGATLFINRLADEIRFQWYPTPAGSATQAQCKTTTEPSVPITPTVSNTDSLMLDVRSEVWSSLWIFGPPSPGRTLETETSEVETYVGSEVEQLVLSLEGPDHRRVELGSLGQRAGVDLDVSDEASGAADPDVIFTQPFASSEVAPVSIKAHYGTGDMQVTGAGGRAFDGAFPAGMEASTGFGDDELTAGVGPAYLSAGGGENVIVGSSFGDQLVSNGSATITAGTGDDWLALGFGENTADGGPGHDGAGFILWDPPRESDRGVHVRLGHSGPQDVGFGSSADLISIERLAGSRYNDRLVGTASADRIEGWQGYDRLVGRAGNDLLLGGDGNDRVGGGGGSDVLRGNRDFDLLTAQDGVRDKRLSCGPGAGTEERAAVDARDPAPRSC